MWKKYLGMPKNAGEKTKCRNYGSFASDVNLDGSLNRICSRPRTDQLAGFLSESSAA
jgi:hypothetical protein